MYRTLLQARFESQTVVLIVVQLMWRAHLARVFTGGTPVPLFQTAPLPEIEAELDPDLTSLNLSYPTPIASRARVSTHHRSPKSA